MALEITDANFDELVLKSDKPVLIDFWAEWCGPCRMVGPIVEEIAKDYEGKAVVGKVNVDNNPDLGLRYAIQAIPTLHYFVDGRVAATVVGTASAEAILTKLRSLTH